MTTKQLNIRIGPSARKQLDRLRALWGADGVPLSQRATIELCIGLASRAAERVEQMFPPERAK